MDDLHELSNAAKFEWLISVEDSQSAKEAWSGVREYCPRLLELGVVRVHSYQTGALVEDPTP